MDTNAKDLFGVSEMQFAAQRETHGRYLEFDASSSVSSALSQVSEAIRRLGAALDNEPDSPEATAARALLLCVGSGCNLADKWMSLPATSSELAKALSARAEWVASNFDDNLNLKEDAGEIVLRWWAHQCAKMDRWREDAEDEDAHGGSCAGEAWKSENPGRSLPSAFAEVLRICRTGGRESLTEELHAEVVKFFEAESIDVSEIANLDCFTAGFAGVFQAPEPEAATEPPDVDYMRGLLEGRRWVRRRGDASIPGVLCGDDVEAIIEWMKSGDVPLAHVVDRDGFVLGFVDAVDNALSENDYRNIQHCDDKTREDEPEQPFSADVGDISIAPGQESHVQRWYLRLPHRGRARISAAHLEDAWRVPEGSLHQFVNGGDPVIKSRLDREAGLLEGTIWADNHRLRKVALPSPAPVLGTEDAKGFFESEHIDTSEVTSIDDFTFGFVSAVLLWRAPAGPWAANLARFLGRLRLNSESVFAPREVFTSIAEDAEHFVIESRSAWWFEFTARVPKNSVPERDLICERIRLYATALGLHHRFVETDART